MLPEYVFAPSSVNLPDPNLVRVPPPEITPGYGTSSLRLNVTLPVVEAPDVTTLVVVIDPVVDPDPIETVPFAAVSGPLNEFSPVKVSVPVPTLVSPPELDDVVPLKMVDEPLPPEVSVPLRVIAPDPASDPTVSALPPMSNVPSTVRAEASGMTSAAPSRRVPALTSVVLP